MTNGRVSEADIVAVLAGEKVVVPLADGGRLILIKTSNGINLTRVGKGSIIKAPTRPGEGAAEVSPG